MRRIVFLALLLAGLCSVVPLAQGTAFASGTAPAKCGPLPLAAGCHLTTPRFRKLLAQSPLPALSPLTPTCSGNGCNYTDPYTSGCAANFWTVQGVWAPDGSTYLELEWSPLCGTNWTQLYNANPWGAVTWLYAAVNRAAGPDGPAIWTRYYSANYSWINSDQLWAPDNLAEACGANSSGILYCTDWH